MPEIHRSERDTRKNILMLLSVLALLVVGDVLLMTQCTPRSGEEVGGVERPADAAREDGDGEEAQDESAHSRFVKALAGSTWAADNGASLYINPAGSVIETPPGGSGAQAEFDVTEFEGDADAGYAGTWSIGGGKPAAFSVDVGERMAIDSAAFSLSASYVLVGGGGGGV